MTLEWQVSSPPPIFNFTEIPQVVGSPYEYGVPGAQHAILDALEDACRRKRSSRDMKQIVVIANETVVSKALVDLIEERAQERRRLRHRRRAGEPAAAGLCRLLRHAARVDPATSRPDARRLREAGIRADGIVVECDPVSALRDAIDQLIPTR